MEIFPSEERKEQLLAIMTRLGTASVEVNFCGGGDSGEITDVNLLRADRTPIDISAESLDWEEESSLFEAGEWKRTITTKRFTLSEALRAVTYVALDHSNLDWYNNEGGQGYLLMDLTKTPPLIELDVDINITDTENHIFTFSGTREEK